MTKVLHIFNRSLRVQDNLGLKFCEELVKTNGTIHSVFIFDPQQITSNDYFSVSCFAFMLNCLEELALSLPTLEFFYDRVEKVVTMLDHLNKYDKIVIVEDYTPYARERVEMLRKIVGDRLIEVMDLTMNSPFKIKPYKKFKPYYTLCYGMNKKEKIVLAKCSLNQCVHSGLKSLKLKDLIHEFDNKFGVIEYMKRFAPVSTRKHALKILDSIKKHKKFSDYLETRDDPNLPTTRLSALMKFGVISIREVYLAIVDGIADASKSVKNNLEGLLREIYFRQFYMQTTYHFGKSPDPRYNKLKWRDMKNDVKDDTFAAWKKGKTGIPFVDAGMRQLLTENWMHNRLRMIVASFLVKNLLIDWRKGEKFFAQNLVDYDYSSNLGGWLWILGSLDGMPYFRVFNPMTQGKVHDPDATYIKKYLPELSELTPKEIHNWDNENVRQKARERLGKIDYPDPIVDLAKSHDDAIVAYKKALKK